MKIKPFCGKINLNRRKAFCLNGYFVRFGTIQRTEGVKMAVRLNEDREVVKRIKEGLKAKDGYCPCRLPKSEEYKCICKEFREQMADPDFEGYCHCMLYYKSKD